MKSYLESLDRQILHGLRIGEQFRGACPRNVRKILFCGMGGSAISGDVVRVLVGSTCKLPFTVNRSPDIPQWVDSETLVIFSSYSGNAAEILSALEQMRKLKAPVLIISAGGKLAGLAEKKKLPFLRLPAGMMPRFSIAYTTFALLTVFKQWKWFQYTPADIKETIAGVRSLNSAKAAKIARQIHGRLAHFYGATGYNEPVLMRWRGQLAENAKMLSSHYLLPEMFHNEIEGWLQPKEIVRKSTAVFFMDAGDPFWMKKKIRAAGNIFKKRGARVLEIASRGRSRVARLFYGIALGDWVSYELALLNKVHPLEIPTIEGLKKIY